MTLQIIESIFDSLIKATVSQNLYTCRPHASRPSKIQRERFGFRNPATRK